MSGVEGLGRKERQFLREVTNPPDSRKALERATIEGDSPVGEIGADFLDQVPEYHGARETLWESGETTLQG
jgi:hypothetical protein